ncbi:CocE/NonD family hydrolase [Mycolicibacterium sarraceniae]|uniref:Hydrolase n=1 Tax=Mycolicibacterium sarraceniae TaxID=1534348 RepID=A0A7I7SSY8_9MYCO|nr:CocE/NonD family hydrolase [Mycolicibacterium sarraceniae]BBY60117.1 hydrolase [Mycolicibacterium sarraceniae]
MVAAVRLSERALSRFFRIAVPTTDYTIHRSLGIPMRDGAILRATHYAPAVDTPLGTILVRGPYGRSFPFSLVYARLYAARGYHVLLQSVRGTFGSGGDFVPMVHEADDAADTVVWLRRQPWFTATFATIGLSYLGFTQWALLCDPPPELAAAVITVGPHDLYASSWGTGSFSLNDFLGWSDSIAHQEEAIARRLAFQTRDARRLDQAMHGLPLGSAGRDLLGTQSRWYESWIQHPRSDDPFWADMRMTSALDRSDVPVLLITGWQDLFLDQTLLQYRHLRDRGVEVAMTVGPWAHGDMVTKAAGIAAGETLDWLGAHLAGVPAPTRRSPVRTHVGRHGWIDLTDWPPATGEGVLYLQPAGRLAASAPPADAMPSSFRYDPADPTPTVGGRFLARNSGYRDDSALARRADVLSFTSGPLDADLYVFGNPVVELAHESDIDHVDLFVRVSEVDARGRSQNVSDGYRRLSAPAQGPISIELDAIAYRFRAGTQIRVLVAGGSHPRFARNLGTGEPALTGQRMVPAVHTVHHGAGGVSRLLLPASGRLPSPDGSADPAGDLV